MEEAPEEVRSTALLALAHVRLQVKLSTLNSPTSHVFSIDKEDNLIGRADPNASIFPEVDLTVHDVQTKVSRRHARI